MNNAFAAAGSERKKIIHQLHLLYLDFVHNKTEAYYGPLILIEVCVHTVNYVINSFAF